MLLTLPIREAFFVCIYQCLPMKRGEQLGIPCRMVVESFRGVMRKNTIKQNAKNNSKGTAQKKLVSLLPSEVCIHIDSYERDKGISIRCPYKNLLFEDGETKFVFGNGATLAEGTELNAVIDYPLSVEVPFKVPLSFFITDMVDIICEEYREIYHKEEETSTKKAMTMDEEFPGCGMLNRNFTDGCYGIWGHELGDLYIERLELDTESKELILCVGS